MSGIAHLLGEEKTLYSIFTLFIERRECVDTSPQHVPTYFPFNHRFKLLLDFFSGNLRIRDKIKNETVSNEIPQANQKTSGAKYLLIRSSEALASATGPKEARNARDAMNAAKGTSTLVDFFHRGLEMNWHDFGFCISENKNQLSFRFRLVRSTSSRERTEPLAERG